MSRKTIVIVVLGGAVLSSMYLSRCYYFDCETGLGETQKADTNIDSEAVQRKLIIANDEKAALASQNQKLEEVLTRYQKAVEDRESVEAQLQSIEQQVEAFELELDAIEEAGGDPATDSQQQTLEKFQSLFNNYQDTMYRLELAETAEEEALYALDSERNAAQ